MPFASYFIFNRRTVINIRKLFCREVLNLQCQDQTSTYNWPVPKVINSSAHDHAWFRTAEINLCGGLVVEVMAVAGTWSLLQYFLLLSKEDRYIMALHFPYPVWHIKNIKGEGMAKAKDNIALKEYLLQLPWAGWVSKIKTEQNQVNASFIPQVNFSNYSLKCKSPRLTF